MKWQFARERGGGRYREMYGMRASSPSGGGGGTDEVLKREEGRRPLSPFSDVTAMLAICHRQILVLVFQRARAIDRKLMYFRFHAASRVGISFLPRAF